MARGKATKAPQRSIHNPAEQQVKKRERLLRFRQSHFDEGTLVFPDKLDEETWRMQIDGVHLAHFEWLVSRVAHSLSYLKILRTEIDTWRDFDRLKTLHVLDLSELDLSAGLPAELAYVTTLKALIVVGCRLKTVEHVAPLVHLNTLILNRNELTSLPAEVGSLPNIEKISASHNMLDGDGLPDLTHCSRLKQIRFSHNPITFLPAHFAQWARLNGGLECIWLASTGLSADESLDAIFAHSSALLELAINNNPLVKTDIDLYAERCKQSLPKLRIYNGIRFDENHRKAEQRAARLARKEERKEEARIFEEKRREAKLLAAQGVPDPLALTPEQQEAKAKARKDERKAAKQARLEQKRITKALKKERKKIRKELRAKKAVRSAEKVLPRARPADPVDRTLDHSADFIRFDAEPCQVVVDPKKLPKKERKALQRDQFAAKKERRAAMRQRKQAGELARPPIGRYHENALFVVDATPQPVQDGAASQSSETRAKKRKRVEHSARVTGNGTANHELTASETRKKPKETPGKPVPDSNSMRDAILAMHHKKKPKAAAALPEGQHLAAETASRDLTRVDGKKHERKHRTSVAAVIDVDEVSRKSKKRRSDVAAVDALLQANDHGLGDVKQW